MDDRPTTLVGKIAARLRAGLELRTGELTSMFAETIPEFRHDDEVRRVMVASTSSNLLAILDILSLTISRGDITVPPAAAEYARRFAQHGLSLEALLRAYRLGEHSVMQWALTEARAVSASSDDGLQAVSHIALVVNDYIDRVLEGVIDIYDSERRRWDSRTDATVAARLRAVLDTEGLDVDTAEKMLGTSLRRWHVAALIWSSPTAQQASDPLRTGVAMLSRAVSAIPIAVAMDEQSRWAWISSTSRPTIHADRLQAELDHHPELHITLGQAGTGLEGFRQTFCDAQCARRVALVAAEGPRLTLHSRVALAGLFADRLPDVRLWVNRVLGNLLIDDAAMVRLRETLQAFLDTQGSYVDAAARVHVHKNTVHYRLRQAEDVLGHSIDENRLELQLALRLYVQLGLDRDAHSVG